MCKAIVNVNVLLSSFKSMVALEAATATGAPAAVEERNAFMDESSSGGDSDEAASDVDEVMDDPVLKYCAICRKSSEEVGCRVGSGKGTKPTLI